MFSSLSFSEQNLLKPIVDSLLSTLHASANRILHCEASRSLFFLLGLPPSFLASRGLAAQHSRGRALPLLNLKKRETSRSLFLVFSRECSFKTNITCWPLSKVSRHSSIKGVISNISKTTHSVSTCGVKKRSTAQFF